MRVIKKMLLILMTVIFISSLGVCFAQGEDAKVNKEEATKKAVSFIKEMYGINSEDKSFDSRTEYTKDYENEFYIWNFNFYKNDAKKNTSINVAINANTGRLMNFNKYESEYNAKPSISKLTKEEATKKAEEFAKKFIPNEFKSVKYMKNPFDFSGMKSPVYIIRYIRMINGIVYSNNYVNINVDTKNGEIIGFDCRWDEDIADLDTKNVIRMDKARKILEDSVVMNLNYITKYDKYEMQRKENNLNLVYVNDSLKGLMMDAVSGDMIGYDGKKNDESRCIDLKDEEKTEFLSHYKNVDSNSKEATREEASSIMEGYVKDIFGDGYVLKNIRYMEGSNYIPAESKKAWGGEFANKDNEAERINITIDAIKKSVSGVYKSDIKDKNSQSKLTGEEAYKRAIAFIEKVCPDKIKEIDTRISNLTKGDYISLRFNRVVNGIDCIQDGITVGFVGENIVSLNVDWNDIKNLPSKDKIISKDKAREIFLKNNKVELTLVKINRGEDINKPALENRLVYILSSEDNSAYIDALSGKLLNFMGEEVKPSGAAFIEKVNNHWAKDILSILSSNGIIDGNSFDMNRDITKLEAIKMLVKASGYDEYMGSMAKEVNFSDVPKGSEEYNYIKLAVRYNIIDDDMGKLNLKDKISRQEMCKMLACFAGYKDLAKKSEIFKLNIKDSRDVKKGYEGYVAICSGLKILEENDGKIFPSKNASMLDVAVCTYKTLNQTK